MGRGSCFSRRHSGPGVANSMKPAQMGLWVVSAAMCAISIGFLFDDFARDQPNLITEPASNSAPAQELAVSVTAETSQPDELDVLDPAAQNSSHAIVPDTPQATASSPPPNADLPTPQVPSADPPVKEASPPITPTPAHPAGEPSPTIPQDEFVTITSA